jgi:hypothetical protein
VSTGFSIIEAIAFSIIGAIGFILTSVDLHSSPEGFRYDDRDSAGSTSGALWIIS